MSSLNFEVRYVRINDVKTKNIAIQIAPVEARGDVQRVMTWLEELQSKLTGSVGLSLEKAHETAVVRIVRGLAVDEVCSCEGLRRDRVDHAPSRTVRLRACI